MDFGVAAWTAWSANLNTKEQWLAWASDQIELTEGEARPHITGMPGLLKRRAHALGRIALEVIFNMPKRDIPIIFCSRHGELHRTLELLKELTETNKVSPQNFCMAVHNAIPSLYTISQNSHANITALSAGPCSALYGLIEAISLLAHGHDMVRLVVANQTLPNEYQSFAHDQMATYAYAIDLTNSQDYKLQLLNQSSLKIVNSINPDLSCLQFLISKLSTAIIRDEQRYWKLSRASHD